MAHAGVCSRRKAERYIREGRVIVDGQVVTELGTTVDPKKNKVFFDGKPVVLSDEYAYFMLNKPPGFLTTLSDPYGRPTIKDLLKDIKARVYPVGRLDKDSQGLLLLTNDGELSYRLLHPRFKVPKKYIVTVLGHPSPKLISRLEQGVDIGEGKVTQPCKITPLGRRKRESVYEVILNEGRKRQIRYMFRAVGFKVIRLIRTEMGPLKLGDLPLGKWRRLEKSEVAALKKAAGLDKQ